MAGEDAACAVQHRLPRGSGAESEAKRARLGAGERETEFQGCERQAQVAAALRLRIAAQTEPEFRLLPAAKTVQQQRAVRRFPLEAQPPEGRVGFIVRGAREQGPQGQTHTAVRARERAQPQAAPFAEFPGCHRGAILPGERFTLPLPERLILPQLPEPGTCAREKQALLPAVPEFKIQAGTLRKGRAAV